MNSNEHLNELICSALEQNLSHYVCLPISLQCGHPICKSCIPVDKKQIIKCKKCGHVTERDLSNDKESSVIQAMIRLCLPDLFLDIETKFLEGIASIKSMFDAHNETFDLKVKYIEEEIEIRIESMKNELNQLEVKLKDELARIVNECKKDEKLDLNIDKKCKTFENKLNELKNDLKKNQTRNEERFYYHQENFKVLKQSIKNLEESTRNFKVSFTPSEFKLGTDSVGYLTFDKNKLNKLNEKVERILKCSNYETLPLSTMHLCFLSNKQFISINTTAISIYDQNFNLLKSIDSIDNQNLDLYGMAINTKEKIYVSNFSYHCVVKLDLNLNKMKTFGSKGSSKSELSNPTGLCFRKKRLYVADYANKRIQILNDNLDYVDTVQLDYGPITIAISLCTIGVCGHRNGVYFYDINTNAEKHRYSTIFGRINEINSYFYVISYSPSKQLFVFDPEGALVREVKLDRFNDVIQSWWDGHLLFVNEHLYMTSNHNKQILKF